MPLSSVSTPPGTTRIDPNGDVLFAVGPSDPKVHLLVSSKVLSLASPVFTAMFRHGFQEGSNLSTGSLHPIPLPDDHVGAITLLFNALHFRSQDLPRNQDLSTLAHLAIVCDKYDCVAAVASWSTLWLHRLETPTSKEASVMMLCTSYSLDVPESFAKASVALMKEQAGTGGHIALPGFDIAPEHLADDVQRARDELFSKLDVAITNAVLPLITNNAWCVRTRIGGYFTNLSNLGLWPPAELRKFSAQEALKKATNLVEPERGSTPCTNSRCFCRSSIRQLKEPLLEALAKEVHLAKGMCLDCTKTGGESAREGTCRTPHPKPTQAALLF